MLDYAANFAERNICFSIAEEEVISITCFLFELLIGIMPCLSLKSLIRHTHIVNLTAITYLLLNT